MSNKKSNKTVAANKSGLTCRVDGCDACLKIERTFYRRSRCCQKHARDTTVLLDGEVRRFCQQCCGFHEIGAFDHSKRSCRDRLEAHNSRQRKKWTGIRRKPAKDSKSGYSTRPKLSTLRSRCQLPLQKGSDAEQPCTAQSASELIQTDDENLCSMTSDSSIAVTMHRPHCMPTAEDALMTEAYDLLQEDIRTTRGASVVSYLQDADIDVPDCLSRSLSPCNLEIPSLDSLEAVPLTARQTEWQEKRIWPRDLTSQSMPEECRQAVVKQNAALFDYIDEESQRVWEKHFTAHKRNGGEGHVFDGRIPVSQGVPIITRRSSLTEPGRAPHHYSVSGISADHLADDFVARVPGTLLTAQQVMGSGLPEQKQPENSDKRPSDSRSSDIEAHVVPLRMNTLENATNPEGHKLAENGHLVTHGIKTPVSSSSLSELLCMGETFPGSQNWDYRPECSSSSQISEGTCGTDQVAESHSYAPELGLHRFCETMDFPLGNNGTLASGENCAHVNEDHLWRHLLHSNCLLTDDISSAVEDFPNERYWGEDEYNRINALPRGVHVHPDAHGSAHIYDCWKECTDHFIDAAYSEPAAGTPRTLALARDI